MENAKQRPEIGVDEEMEEYHWLEDEVLRQAQVLDNVAATKKESMERGKELIRHGCKDAELLKKRFDERMQLQKLQGEMATKLKRMSADLTAAIRHSLTDVIQEITERTTELIKTFTEHPEDPVSKAYKAVCVATDVTEKGKLATTLMSCIAASMICKTKTSASVLNGLKADAREYLEDYKALGEDFAGDAKFQESSLLFRVIAAFDVERFIGNESGEEVKAACDCARCHRKGAFEPKSIEDVMEEAVAFKEQEDALNSVTSDAGVGSEI